MHKYIPIIIGLVAIGHLLSPQMAFTYRLCRNYLNNKTNKLSVLKIASNGRYCMTDVFYNGFTYTLYLPYDSNIIFNMTNSKVIVETDKEQFILKHPPGVPFFVNGNMLDAKTVEILDMDSDIKQTLPNILIPKV